MATEKQTLLTQTRKSRGLSLDQVAKAVGTDPTNLSRVEKGTQQPKSDLAIALYKFYGGVVPLDTIYFPHGAPECCPMCAQPWLTPAPKSAASARR